MTSPQHADAILMLEDEFDIMDIFTLALEHQDFHVIGFRATPEKFQFSIKVPGTITHVKRLDVNKGTIIYFEEFLANGPDWNSICNQVQSLLVQSCGDLVNSDGTLKQSGETAVGCGLNELKSLVRQ